MNLITLTPFTRILNDWPIVDRRIVGLLDSVPADYSFSNFTDTVDQDAAQQDPWTLTVHVEPDLFQKSFLHVVTCSVFNYPNVYTSEKNFKPIINLRPFILVSSPGSLANMRELGFKTFSDYWCEDYDMIDDPTLRMETIVKLIQSICDKPLQELTYMLKDMRGLLAYNYDYYYHQFIDNEITKFEKQCQKNLLNR